MSDISAEGAIGAIGVPEFVGGIAAAVNETYSYANNSLFYALIPSYYRDYATRYLRPSFQWLDGYVYSLHAGGASGIISTRIGTKLISGLTKQIVGESLVFKLKGKDDDDALADLRKISEWGEKANARKAVFGAIGFALASGTSLIKINRSEDGELWWEPARLDNAYFLSSFRGEVKEATFVIRNYIDTRKDKGDQQFFLTERRFYKVWEEGLIEKNPDGTYTAKKAKGQKDAMVEYSVHLVRGTSLNNLLTDAPNGSVKWQELPKDIRDSIKRDYSAIRLNEPQLIGLPNLGVEIMANGCLDLSVPTGTVFGESMLVGIQDDMIQYEIASSYALRDMYLAKGTVYVPKDLNLSDIGGMGDGNPYGNAGVLGGIGEGKIERIKGVSPEEQSIVVEQFQIRSAEWQNAKENALKNIAVKWGMSPKILASFLAQGAVQMTATQIDSEDDMSVSFINTTRSYFEAPLNRLLETTMNYYGLPSDVKVGFASPSILNKDRLLARVEKELELGLIDIDEAVRKTNPDLGEEALKARIDQAKKAQAQRQASTLAEMGWDGGFADAEDAKGTTEP